ncbi:MAG: NPCBM/NEW2 domain-containing protein [Verrucomicrobia bacterium]|nr:NPCBM/NEW2 domain-containing protein [Verrucomicrobiota bacterium]
MKILFIIPLLVTALVSSAAETVPLTSLDLSKMTQGWGKPQIDRSIREKPLSIGGQKFEHGVGTHANSTLWIDLAGGSERFLASIGVDDNANGPATVTFKIVGDGKKLLETGVMKPGDKARSVDLDLKGLKTLILMVGDGGDGVGFDHANWADARFVVSGAKPKALDRPMLKETAVILTPKPGPAPRINGPRVTGCRPGNPFIFRIPTTGERPIAFTVENLPSSLKLDAANGIITGTAPARGEFTLTLRAKNSHGEATRAFKIVSGDTLALTPPMGWNHWYTHYDRITDQLMREAADVMASSGMADVGYQYVSIDDCWMNAPKNKDPLRVGPLRDAQGNLIPNKHFPDMVAMTEYIHSKGLKAGIYTSPGPLTCAGFAATYQHEEQDAKLFADWGFDFLKYDWCSYGGIAKKETGPELAKFKKPYQQMGDILKRQKRDIVFNLCQYGMGNVWEWGAEVGGHCWRTAGDLGFELDRIFPVALKNAEHRAWSKPGAWNDPDYIQIGRIGNARGMGEPIASPLTPSEQYSFMSLWCLSAAPLFFSGDMGKLDEFTVNVLCNSEVIDVDQDPLGQCARVVPVEEETFVMVKDLEDGSKAVGLFNRSEVETSVTAKWSDLGVKGPQTLRDLWRQKELGRFENEFKASVPRHGVVMVRMTGARP